MFENAVTNTKQGDIGEARAIYEYTRLGYGVSRTLFDSMKYDLIIDVEGTLKRVQVKTTRYKTKYDIYQATLKTTGGNTTCSTIKNREDNDYDILFVLAEDGTCWSIPIAELNCKTTINLGETYDRFKL
ncbi:hypothetical protein [Acinetobacter phage vB_AbaM_CP14]|nr:hypothetical protein [Acinetobacter phage vB_AbaM_CP14]